MSPHRCLWWCDGRFNALRQASYGLSLRGSTCFVAQLWTFSIYLVSFHVWSPDNIVLNNTGIVATSRHVNVFLISPCIFVDDTLILNMGLEHQVLVYLDSEIFFYFSGWHCHHVIHE